ncbi:hypothetical protein F5880DRAFT_1599619 [Lentinula raphanica]|nr:hypothetical protein F5880DRAFT_1599619 [Lentinula raphanica]
MQSYAILCSAASPSALLSHCWSPDKKRKTSQSWSPNFTVPRNRLIKTTRTFLLSLKLATTLSTIMILSRSTSMMFLAAVGMNTVLGLPILNEQNLQSSPPAPDVQNVQAPAVQEISKRMDGDPNRLLPLEPKWSPSGPPNPRLSSTIPVTGTAYKRPLPAQDLPPGAYPPAFGWTGGRVFKIEPDYKKKLQVVSSKQIENLEIEEKMEFLNNCYEVQIARCVQQEHQCGDDDQKMREIRQEREEIKNFQRRVRDLGNKLNKSMEEDNLITNDNFIKNMKVLCCTMMTGTKK